MPVGAELAQLASRELKPLESTFLRTDVGTNLLRIVKEQYIPHYAQMKEALFSHEMTVPKLQQHAPEELESMARNAARLHAFGPNDAIAVGHIKALAGHGNPLQANEEQQNLADALHMFLKDTKKTPTGPQSVFKRRVRFSDEPVKIDTGAIYKPPTDTERVLTNFIHTTLAPFIAIPHIGTILNVAINAPLQDFARGMAQATFNNKNIRQMVKDHGLFAGTVADAYSVRYRGTRGIITKFTGSDTLGSIVAQITHQPGFNALREWTISIGAAAGKLTAERAANKYYRSGGKDLQAKFHLERAGIDLKDVIAKKGQLDPDMLRKAIFSSVDQRVFLDNTLHRSFNSSKDVYHRMAFMYHGYVSRQGRLMADALYKTIWKRQGGLALAAQTFGVLALAFPAVGEGLKTLEMYGRGQWDDPDSNPLDGYARMAGAEGPQKALAEWVDAYTHMAAFGVATSYQRAAFRHSLANAAVGPVGNMIARLGEDSIAAFANIGDDKEWEKSKPLVRDLLEDSMPDNLGKVITHQFLKTQSELRRENPHRKLPKFPKQNKFPKTPHF